MNEKLAELEQLQARLAELDDHSRSISEQERDEILRLGEHFQEGWESEHCPNPLRKQLIRTVVEEVLVDQAPP